MTSLPPNVSNFARVARYRVVRQLAIDVCLSSVGISIENKLVSASRPPQEEEEARVSLPIHERGNRFSRDSSPTFFSSQLAAISGREPDHRLPTPAKTPSLYSHATSTSDFKEDSSITRLRQYAPFGKARPDLSMPSLCSHWPSEPGSDPAQYSYQEAQKAVAAAESGNESEHRNRKEEARRRRRTQKFFRQERSRAVEAAAQSMFMPSGSQPAASRHFASSQTADDLPMTQPELGTFGSRVAQEGKKKSKKPRAAGFR
jgi:RNA polymerase I-specific transcription initiation factor RRN6